MQNVAPAADTFSPYWMVPRDIRWGIIMCDFGEGELYNSDMQYLVDGHNLIPKLGLRLDSFDDEVGLVARLQEFCRIRRARAEVYFDGAPPGYSGLRQMGAVCAYFVRIGSSADAAIEVRLDHLGRSARNWTVVSSDHRIQVAAQAAHAKVLSSEGFTQLMSAAQAQQSMQLKNEGQLSPEDVQEWLSIFKRRG